MLERSRAQNVHCDGQQLIVLITDGAPDDSEAEQQQLLDLIETKTNYGHPTNSVPVYSYGIGNDIVLSTKSKMAKEIACKTGGSYTGIMDDQEPEAIVKSYCTIAMLSRFVAFSLLLTWKVSLLQTKVSLLRCGARKLSGASHTSTRAGLGLLRQRLEPSTKKRTVF